MINPTYLNAGILAAIVATALVLWSPMILRSTTWRAMTTPLASIIGSGFLILGPVLDHAYGRYAPLVMAALCAGAYMYGAAIRYNIAACEKTTDPPVGVVGTLELVASWALAFAYIISVAYYLNLFGAFGVSLTPVDDEIHAKLLTTAIFAIILVVGWTRGFKMLEDMEYISVSIKLAVIAGLLLGLLVYFFKKTAADELTFNSATQTGWSALTLGFGLIVTVQGFETSRYLGAEYDSRTRIESMRWAQWTSSAIYILYIFLVAYVFQRGELQTNETAIVGMMEIVAPILPGLLVAAALAAQFSAAVADTSGSGGLAAELTNNRVTPRVGYAVLVAIGLMLTWSANVFEIIAYASRAFAIYYALQAGIAALRSWHAPNDRLWAVVFAAFAALGVLIAILGQAVDT